ncbi:hypothetical protein FRC09_008090 [Ceratobasidium sp. 395]|nr:hypothetical protein FRC09_008090 [Ceratobasidium sp. 395]
MGRVLARRAAAATRTVSRRSGGSRSNSRAGFGGATLTEVNAETVQAGAVEQQEAEPEPEVRTRPRVPPLDMPDRRENPNRGSVIVDDRSPHDGQPFWTRVVGPVVSIAPSGSSAGVVRVGSSSSLGTATVVPDPPPPPPPLVLALQPPMAKGSVGPRNELADRDRNRESFAASQESLRSFVFPAQPEPEPEQEQEQEPEPFETHVRVHVQTPLRTQFQVHSQTPVRAQFQVETSEPSPTQLWTAHSPTQIQMQSPVHLRAAQSPSQMRAAQSPRTLRIQTQTQSRPVSFIVQASPTSVFVSPVDSASWAMGPGGVSPIATTSAYRASPAGYRASPTGHRASPALRASDAHMDLLRGLSPLPSHGLPLPSQRPHSISLLDRTGANLPRRFSMTIASPESARPVDPMSAVPESLPQTPSPPVATSSPPRRAALSPPRQAAPSPPRRSMEQTPMAAPALVASPSPLPRRASSSSQFLVASPPSLPQPFPTTSSDAVPTRALSPLPPRLRYSTGASHPSEGSGSDEGALAGNSSSASSVPAARYRRRSRPRRPHRRAVSESIRPMRGGEGSVPRRTAQAMERPTSTGNWDAGEVSSDGRDEVVFVPKPPPPPVPRIPTSLAAPVLILPTVSVATPPAAPVAPPLVRKESIPLPEASPLPGAAQLGPPGVPVKSEPVPAPAVLDEPRAEPAREPAEPAPVRPPPLSRKHSSRLTGHLPWSPPPRVLSREGSFYTAPDSFVEDATVDTDAEFPSSVPGSFPDVSYMDDTERARMMSTPAHMDLSELEEVESPMLSAEEGGVSPQEVPATVLSATRAHVVQPVTLTRQSSHEFVRAPGAISSRSGTPARRAGRTGEAILSGVFQQGFLVSPLAPSPPSSGSSRTPPSHVHTASILMRHDNYSPQRIEQLPRSVTPRTEVSVRHPEEDSFQSAHTADDRLRLPLDDWLEFAMGSMAAMGIPLTREILEDLHESEGEALSTSSLRGVSEEEGRGAGFFDGLLPADEDSDGDSASRSLSDVSGTPSPTHSNSGLFSSPRYAGMSTFTTAPESTTTRPTILTTDLGFSTDNPTTLTAISATSEESDSERALESLQNIAHTVSELNLRTPVPSGGSSRPPRSASTSLPMHTPFSGPGSRMGSPPVVGPLPVPGAYQDVPPARTLSPGALSISFLESTPTLSSVPALVVPPEDRDRFADSLLIRHHQHQHSSRNLRADEYRALDEGEDVVLYGVGGEWERVETRRIRTESHGTAESGIPIELADYDPISADPQSQSKYTQFLLSFANALRTPGVNRPQRWVEVALRALRSQAPGTHSSELYDAISRAEVEDIPPPPVVPSHLSSTFVSSSSSESSIGSALPDDDQIVEDFVRNILTPTPPPRSVTPIRTDTANVDPNAVPWPVLASPVMPRYYLPPRSPLTSTSSSSGYSSIIPPLPRQRSRTIEPHWLAIYMARRWATAQNQITRRTYSSPSALGPPMPYHWRPICHISPERLWEITNLAVRADMPPPPLPPALSVVESVSPVEIARPHYTTPATTYGRATPYSARTGSSHRSRRTTTPAQRPISVPVPVYPEPPAQMTSHPNLPINPSHHSVALQTSTSRTSIPLVQRPLDPQYVSRTSTSSDRPTQTQTAVVSGAVTPAGAQRKRTVGGLVGRLMGGKERARVRSISHSRSPSPLVGKSRFGLTGRVVDIARRVLRHPRRRARVSSIRSQRAQAVRDA